VPTGVSAAALNLRSVGGCLRRSSDPGDAGHQFFRVCVLAQGSWHLNRNELDIVLVSLPLVMETLWSRPERMERVSRRICQAGFGIAVSFAIFCFDLNYNSGRLFSC